MKTPEQIADLETSDQGPNQTHLLNYGCKHYRKNLHVQFDKETGDVVTLEVREGSNKYSYNLVNDRYTDEELENFKTYARKSYKEQYGHLPENQPQTAAA